ncbi:glycoside hydrolase family 2 protein [Sapientia aquatica]|uniref:Glycoside hydrolase family 2 protein n=1 Tax=Sapientia aquatica TaxID=1549640 RepID=A0A4R5VPT6_9BURK|nr:glycoside hydrolase family 2 TIM barrel-domain containing protein [Sapientia aquatica]TDK60448.1 glycoside hydrolase family 2 protein [Sapientia aquatica]
MKRRNFILSMGAMTAGAALPVSMARAKTALDSAGMRMTLPVNSQWRFSPHFVAGGHDPVCDESRFQKITVPHSNSRLPWHSFDDQSYEFVSLYRRHFKLPPKAKGKHVFIDFEGVMTAATVWINGVRLGEYRGGYTPFSFELTPHINWHGDNVLAVDVDSTERKDIPPLGNQVDYLTFGGIYREVALRIVPAQHLDNVFVKTIDTLSAAPAVDVQCFILNLEGQSEPLELEVDLIDGSTVIASGRAVMTADTSSEQVQSVRLTNLHGIRLWNLQDPSLYSVQVRLLRTGVVIDQLSRRFGFRVAEFTDHGFELNGKVVKLRGLNRHQTFPYVGQAMGARVQKRDAEILRKKLKCNIVRTSHYPNSSHFLDACDELGLLVLEEIPGWQFVGNEAWREVCVDNVQRMIRRDWNHPSIILWGVRVNESQDFHDFYTKTNALAHRLDPTRQTGGIRYFQESEFLEDVFTMNDFEFPLKAPNHPRYLNTEFVGHTYPTKTIDSKERLMEHTLRHARIHDQLASSAQYSGGLGWCAFDYNTHADFGSGDRICYHGVSDIFREPKPAAGFYKSQCDPAEEIVLEPAFHWSRNDESIGIRDVLVCSNCEHVKFYIDSKLVAEADPDRKQFPHLPYAPFIVDLYEAAITHWGDLRMEGYINGRMVISKTLSGKGIDQKFALFADDEQLIADGIDATRVVIRMMDEFGAIRQPCGDAVVLHLEGPAELIGPNPFSLVAGSGAVWLRTTQQSGLVRLTATHALLGSASVTVRVSAAGAELV